MTELMFLRILCLSLIGIVAALASRSRLDELSGAVLRGYAAGKADAEAAATREKPDEGRE